MNKKLKQLLLVSVVVFSLLWSFSCQGQKQETPAPTVQKRFFKSASRKSRLWMKPFTRPENLMGTRENICPLIFPPSVIRRPSLIFSRFSTFHRSSNTAPEPAGVLPPLLFWNLSSRGWAAAKSNCQRCIPFTGSMWRKPAALSGKRASPPWVKAQNPMPSRP